MRCPDCGAGNSDQDKFCAFCGHDLSEAFVAPPLNETDAELTPEGVSYSDEPKVISPVAEVKENKKRKRGPLLVVAGLVLALLIGIGAFAYSNLTTKTLSPEALLTEAYFELMEAQEGTVRSNFRIDEIHYDLNDPDAQMIIDLVQELEVNSEVSFDVDSRQLEGKLKFNLMGADLVTLAYYFDTEKMMLDIPLIHDKAFFISYEDMVDLIQGDMIGNMMYGSNDLYASPMMMSTEGTYIDSEQVSSAIDIMVGVLDRDQYESLKNIDLSLYKAITTSYYTEVITQIDVTEEGIEYYMPYDEKEANYLLEDYIDLMVDDPELIAFAEEVISNFYGQVVAKENYLLYALLIEQDLQGVTEWEGPLFEAELELQRQSVIEDLEEEIKMARNDLAMALDSGAYNNPLGVSGMEEFANIDVIITLNEDHQYATQTTMMDMDLSESLGQPLSLTLAVTNDYEGLGQEVVFEGIDYDESLDIGAMDEEAMMKLVIEIQENVMANVMNNPMFSEFFNMGF